jgi:hypothetical protein
MKPTVMENDRGPLSSFRYRFEKCQNLKKEHVRQVGYTRLAVLGRLLRPLVGSGAE